MASLTVEVHSRKEKSTSHSDTLDQKKPSGLVAKIQSSPTGSPHSRYHSEQDYYGFVTPLYENKLVSPMVEHHRDFSAAKAFPDKWYDYNTNPHVTVFGLPGIDINDRVTCVLIVKGRSFTCLASNTSNSTLCVVMPSVLDLAPYLDDKCSSPQIDAAIRITCGDCSVELPFRFVGRSNLLRQNLTCRFP